MDRCVANGGGSCPVCRASLGLASQKRGGVWYCSSACAEGHPSSAQAPRVPEPWLYGRPRRSFRARLPKELKAAR